MTMQMLKGGTQERILRALDEPRTIEEISQRLGMNRVTVSKYMAVMEAAGTVRLHMVGRAKLFLRK